MERDIVDWLRQLLNQRIAAFGEKGLSGCRYGEAADEIERLRQRVSDLEMQADTMTDQILDAG